MKVHLMICVGLCWLCYHTFIANLIYRNEMLWAETIIYEIIENKWALEMKLKIEYVYKEKVDLKWNQWA